MHKRSRSLQAGVFARPDFLQDRQRTRHKMDLREIRETELQALLAFYRHLHPDDCPLPQLSQIPEVWSSILKNPHSKYYGAFKDGSLVSSCTLSIIQNLTRSCRPYGLIENVVTSPNSRRKGFGEAVLRHRHALEKAWENNCYKVMLLSGRKDEATFQFYENAGFDRNAKQGFVAYSRNSPTSTT